MLEWARSIASPWAWLPVHNLSYALAHMLDRGWKMGEVAYIRVARSRNKLINSKKSRGVPKWDVLQENKWPWCCFHRRLLVALTINPSWILSEKIEVKAKRRVWLLAVVLLNTQRKPFHRHLHRASYSSSCYRSSHEQGHASFPCVVGTQGWQESAAASPSTTVTQGLELITGAASRSPSARVANLQSFRYVCAEGMTDVSGAWV